MADERSGEAEDHELGFSQEWYGTRKKDGGGIFKKREEK